MIVEKVIKYRTEIISGERIFRKGESLELYDRVTVSRGVEALFVLE